MEVVLIGLYQWPAGLSVVVQVSPGFSASPRERTPCVTPSRQRKKVVRLESAEMLQQPGKHVVVCVSVCVCCHSSTVYKNTKRWVSDP